MSDSSATQLKSETEIKRRQESSFLEALVPIPDFFFNIKAEIEPIGGSAWVIRMLAYFLYFLTLCVMFGSFTYYSLPAQRLSLESLVTSEWQKTGFACKPLQKTTLHGMSTDWSYDECVSAVSSPSAENVVSVQKNDGSTQFDFNFASGGTVSFYDVAYASSVLQKTNQATDDWKRDGYSCYPEPPYDNTYNLNYNVSECASEVLPPSLDTVAVETDTGSVFHTRAKYFPFLSSNVMYPAIAWVASDGTGIGISIRLQSACNALNELPGGYYVRMTGSFCYIIKGSCVSPTLFNQEEISLPEGVEAWSKVVNTPADQYGNFGTDVICSMFKRNGNGFRCFDKPKPPATKELAIQRYASEYPPATICAPLKLNSPFQCTRNVEVPATTRLSLSVAAAQAVFAVAGIILVALLRKLRTPPKSTESLSGDDDIRSVVRKLRITIDKLGTEFRTGQDELRTGQDKLSSGHGEHEELIQKLLSK